MATCIHSCPISYEQIKTCHQSNYTTQPQIDDTWQTIKQEAEADIDQEPVLRNYYQALILCHASLESSLSYILATKLHIQSILPIEHLYTLFLPILTKDPVRSSIRADLKAARSRDPACSSTAHCLLHYKGFLAVQAHRVAHWLHGEGRRSAAYMIQSRVSERFGVDIHPGAKMGCGVLLDHATGVVIGETAVVGNEVTILHNVTLGGNGKEMGDRHPKIGDGVMVGAGTQVLGAVRVGEGAKVGAGSVVVKDVAGWTTVVGNPARAVVRADRSSWSDYVI